MSNYNRDKQGKLTHSYSGEPKVRVNISLTQKCLKGLEELTSATGSNSRSDLVEKIGRGEIELNTNQLDISLTSPSKPLFEQSNSPEAQLLAEVKAKLLEAWTIKHKKQRGANTHSWALIDELIFDVLQIKNRQDN